MHPRNLSSSPHCDEGVMTTLNGYTAAWEPPTCAYLPARTGLSSASRSQKGSEEVLPYRSLTNHRFSVGYLPHTMFAQRGPDFYVLLFYVKNNSRSGKCQITLEEYDSLHNFGMRAWVKVKAIKIADLVDFSQQDSASILRRIRCKLLEHAALETMHARPGLKTVSWRPVEVVQPQVFLSLWILTMETDER